MQCRAAPERILIATPDSFLLAEYRATLRESGIHVSAATSGIQCLEQLNIHIPDLIVLDTDLLWGGADGVLQVLADDPTYPTVPAMVVSSRHHRSALYQVGRFIVADYQLKPLSGKRLVLRIRSLFASNSKLGGHVNNLLQMRSSEVRRTV